MARQGRFGRPTQGSQNLSALIYALLKEERNSQEDTMLRSYTNNMQGGTARNTFTSGGATNAATATSVYQWYLRQADLAQSQGDNVGYNALVQKAEDFRLQSLRDQETVLNNAYTAGTTIDKSLFGGTGVGTISVSEYEQVLGLIAQQPGMTEADISRINRSIFGASYEYAAADTVRQYNEKKINADKLVNFYDKELARAESVGVPQDSARYQAILDARSRAVAAKKADAAQARYDLVANKIKDEKKAFAVALQKFISPVLERMFTSKNTINLLKSKITDDGESFISNLTDVLNASTPGKLAEVVTNAALSAGMTQADVETLMLKVDDYSNEVVRLTEAGYGKELGAAARIATYFGEGVTAGSYNATTRNASTALSKAIGATGGVVNTPLSSDPYATREAFGKFVLESGKVSSSAKYDDIAIADTVYQIGSGDLSYLLPGANDSSIDGVVKQISSETGMEDQDVLKAMIDLMGNQNAWNQNDKTLIAVGQAMTRMGLDTNTLSVSTAPGNELSIGIVARLALESKMVDMVDKDPNLVWTYRRTGTGQYTYVATAVSDATRGDYSIGSSSGNKNEIIYIERVQLKYSDQNNVADAGIFYVAVPGGGDLSNGQMDQNDYVEFTQNGTTMRLTREDLEDFSTYAASTGQDFLTPQVNPQDGTLRIGSGFAKELLNASNSSTFKLWLEVTAADKGQTWYNSKFITKPGAAGLQGAAVDLVGGYVNDINNKLGMNIPPQDRDKIVDEAVDKYITDNNIVDKTGKIRSAIISALAPVEPVVYNTGTTEIQAVGSSYVGGAGNVPAPTPTAPPPPTYVSPYVLNQTGGSYTLPTQDPSSYFFRKTPGALPGAGVLTGAPGGGPVPIIAPPVEPPPTPIPSVTPKIQSLPSAGSSGGRFTNTPIKL